MSAYAVLLDGDDERRRFAAWSVTLPVDDDGTLRHERVIPYREDICPFLDEATDRCTIYDDRPRACRAFECTRHFNPPPRRHGLFLRGNPKVVRLLEES